MPPHQLTLTEFRYNSKQTNGFHSRHAIPRRALLKPLPHLNAGAEPVHVDMSIVSQLLGKFWRQDFVEAGREITQGILQSQLHRERGREGSQKKVTKWVVITAN